ncbi:hypothetical protein [Parvibaculum sp.]|uniref:hypothetical protein n=1 Tax=Parvibaculum sp. TaxID=2024848 RepID=UPI002C4A0D34|nr:hypothetical protein [Parvibaculum sp.]HUD52812.1 hypothetical protein [Parvibaculum sp.]
MTAAPQVVTDAEVFAAPLADKTAEIAPTPAMPFFHLGDAAAGAIAVLMGFYSLAFVGNVLLTY